MVSGNDPHENNCLTTCPPFAQTYNYYDAPQEGMGMGSERLDTAEAVFGLQVLAMARGWSFTYWHALTKLLQRSEHLIIIIQRCVSPFCL